MGRYSAEACSIIYVAPLTTIFPSFCVTGCIRLPRLLSTSTFGSSVHSSNLIPTLTYHLPTNPPKSATSKQPIADHSSNFIISSQPCNFSVCLASLLTLLPL